MAKLTKEEITKISEERGYRVENADEYKNLEEPNLRFICPEGHSFLTSLKVIRDLKTFRCPECDKQTVSYTCKPPIKKQGVFRTIAFDQATQNFGISVYDDKKLVYYDVIRFIGGTEDKFLNIAEFISLVCKEWLPDYVIFEDIQLHAAAENGYNTFKVLAELLGIVKLMLTIHGVPHGCVLNKVWQAQFGISGKTRASQKANVMAKVTEIFGIKVNDDIADAILMGKYAVEKREEKTKKVKMF